MYQTDDWAFCVKSLEGVSRSFARPISLLESPLKESVGTSYLLARIVDTIEDDPHLNSKKKEELYRAFLAFLNHEISENIWQEAVSALQGSDEEMLLVKSMGRALSVLESLPKKMIHSSKYWLSEMCRGMEIYTFRREKEAGPLMNIHDLERYCYFVAGTVGHLLTEHFIIAYPEALNENCRHTLFTHAESFGIALQLVNILKDCARDHLRGFSFLPIDLQSASHAALEPIFQKAYRHLDDAFTYTLAIPPTLKSVRHFLLIPLFLGLKTLKFMERNDALFDPNARIAIARSDAESLIQTCLSKAHDDSSLLLFYETIKR